MSLNFNNKINPIFPNISGPPINRILITDSLYTKCNICLLYYLKVFHSDKCKHYMCEKYLKLLTNIKNECPVCKRSFFKIYPK